VNVDIHGASSLAALDGRAYRSDVVLTTSLC
jgi:hypothetical protein